MDGWTCLALFIYQSVAYIEQTNEFRHQQLTTNSIVDTHLSTKITGGLLTLHHY